MNMNMNMKWVTWDQAAITALLCLAVAMLSRRLPPTKWRARIVSVAVSGSSIILGAMGEIPLRAAKCEEAIASGAELEQASNFADEGTSPSSDTRASADYRRHLAKVLVFDALTEAKQRS